MAEFNAKKVIKVDAGVVDGWDGEAVFSVKGTDDGTFAIASSKKELKQLMKSDADVVYFESKGQLFLNENGAKKVATKVLVARLMQPEDKLLHSKKF